MVIRFIITAWAMLVCSAHGSHNCPFPLAVIATDRIGQQGCNAVTNFDLAAMQSAIYFPDALAHSINSTCDDLGTTPFLQTALPFFTFGLQCKTSQNFNHTQLPNGDLWVDTITTTFAVINGVVHDSIQSGRRLYQEIEKGSCMYKIRFLESFDPGCPVKK